MSNPSSKARPVRILESAHYFHVADLNSSVAFYRDVLGFGKVSIYGDPPFFAIAGRDNVNVMLAQAPDPKMVVTASKKTGSAGAWDAYFWVEDARSAFEDFQAKGARIEDPPEVKPHGCLEFQLADPDGYNLVFGENLDGGS